ncbi:MAG: hypothetical protein Q7R95_11625, partial [bacterium]|nr:hypothetical protein [bacterium]
MKHKILLIIAAVLLCTVIFIKKSISHIQYRSQSEDDMQFTTLVQKIKYPIDQSFQKLTSNKKITLNFTANHNNLGTVAFIFNNYQKINNDWVWFRIKESSSTNWYYQHKYNTEQFNPEYFFSFGFPIISDSKDKKYTLEIESISGTQKNSISLHTKSHNYIAKYDYSKLYLNKNPSQIPYFIFNKLSTS